MARATACRGRPQLSGPRPPRLALLAGVVAAQMLATGLTALASTGAVPGGTLHAVKRSSEQIHRVLIRDPQEHGLRQLSFAQTRLSEIGKLIASGAGNTPSQPDRPDTAARMLNAGKSELVARALSDMDEDIRQGAAIVTGYAVQHRADPALAALAGWASTEEYRQAGFWDRRGGTGWPCMTRQVLSSKPYRQVPLVPLRAVVSLDG